MKLDTRELNTVLAALRILQRIDPKHIPEEYWDEDILSKEEIDSLCERINTEPRGD